MSWHKAAEVDELADGGLKEIVANGKTLVLARDGARYCALDNQCPHAGGPLSQGSIDNGLLVCPWHGREFRLETGACEGFELSVGTYPIEVRADGIFVSA